VFTTPARVKTRPHTRAKALVDDPEDKKGRIRVDSAGLFAKLAIIVPREFADDEDRHQKIMDAVATSTSIREAPDLGWHVRNSYSSPIKGVVKTKPLLNPHPPITAAPKLDDPEFMTVL
jgi:hypothetical protein